MYTLLFTMLNTYFYDHDSKNKAENAMLACQIANKNANKQRAAPKGGPLLVIHFTSPIVSPPG